MITNLAASGQGIFAGRIDATTGTSKLETSNITLSIFPNPTTNSVIVKYTGNATKGNLCITDLSGRTCALQQVNFNEGENSVFIDLHNYSHGMYLLTLETSTAKNTCKLIVE